MDWASLKASIDLKSEAASLRRSIEPEMAKLRELAAYVSAALRNQDPRP